MLRKMPPRRTNRSWIFQANPNRYSIETSLVREQSELWGVRQHRKEVRKGDTVYIWICGHDAGIYAKGRILTDPITQQDSPRGVGYWSSPVEGLREIPRVLVTYDYVFANRPLLKGFLQIDPDLESLSILQNPRGTNFSLTSIESAAIDRWLVDGGLVPN